MDVLLVDAAVTHALLDRTHRIPEVVHVQLLETCTRKCATEVDAVHQRIDLDGGLSGRRESALGTLALCPQPANGTVVAREILATVLPLEVLHAEVDDTIV